jgi:hypothetical protein
VLIDYYMCQGILLCHDCKSMIFTVSGVIVVVMLIRRGGNLSGSE